MFRSLKARLAIWIFLPTTLLVTVDIAAIYRNSENIADTVQQRMLYGSAKIISEQLIFDEQNYHISIPPAAFELFRGGVADQVYYAVHTKEGKLIAGGDELLPYKNPIDIEEEKFYLSEIDGKTVRVVVLAYALPNSSSGDFAVTQVAQTLRGRNELRDNMIISMIRGHLLLLSISVISLFVALRWTLDPLQQFSHTLAQRSPGSLDKLDNRSAPTELEPVIHALNAYAEKLGQTLFSYERFVSNTAHHLRTSFAIMASQIDFGKRGAANPQILAETLNSIQKTLSESNKLINQLLVLASVEQTRQDRANEVPVCLAEIITKIIEETAPLAQQRDIELGVDDFDETLLVTARPHLLHEVFSNLVANAIQHMGKPGNVTLSLRKEGKHAHIRVIDDGLGVPQELQEKLFDRFFRINTSRADSSGLGLAIVKEICDALDGKVRVSTPLSGSGLQFDLYFPLTSA